MGQMGPTLMNSNPSKYLVQYWLFYENHILMFLLPLFAGSAADQELSSKASFPKPTTNMTYQY